MIFRVQNFFVLSVLGSFIRTELHSVNFSRSLRTFVQFVGCQMINIDFSYSNLKHSIFQNFWRSPQRLNFFRANLQYASLDDSYFDNITVFGASYKHNATINRKIHEDPNLLLSPTSSCVKRIVTDWKSESVNENAVLSNQINGTCYFSLESNTTRVVLSRNLSMVGIWEPDTWPMSYGIMIASMSVDVLVELLGVDKTGAVINSIVMSKSS